MEAKATHTGAHCTPRKARLLRGLIIGKPVALAAAILSAERRAGAEASLKLLKSALAQVPATLRASGVVKDLVVNEGPKRRMFMPRAQGRATPVIKRSSHITIKVGFAGEEARGGSQG